MADILAVRGYRGRHPASSDWPDDAAGSLWHPHGLGHLQFDLEDGRMAYVPADVLARFLRTYMLLGEEAITDGWKVVPVNKGPDEGGQEPHPGGLEGGEPEATRPVLAGPEAHRTEAED